MLQPTVIIFDFDGTLINSEPGILDAIRLTVKELDLPEEAIETWRSMIGIPLKEQLMTLLPRERESEVEKGIQLYREFYAQVGINHSDPFTGIPEILEFLLPKSSLAIASSKRRESILTILHRLQWESYFDPILSPAEVTYPKPHPESIHRILEYHSQGATEAVMIGDTTYDIEMAQRAGVKAWGVSWGVHPLDQLRAAGADECFQDPKDLLSGLERILT
jgi:HAD superfamily hydrolase (TIGR01509 family)